MRLLEIRRASCALCGAENGVRVIDWEKETLTALPLCGRCRARLLAVLAEVAAEEVGAFEVAPTAVEVRTAAAEKIAAEAKTMTEDAFEAKYLGDTLDRVIFEYIHGYGETDMSGEGCAMVVLMMDGTSSEQEVSERLLSLAERGLIYPIVGKPGWYGAELTFADD